MNKLGPQTAITISSDACVTDAVHIFRTEVADRHTSSGSPEPKKINSEMQRSDEGSVKALIVCFVGIFVCYFYYGILQEKITRSDYGSGENKERFSYFFCLVLVQCIINAIFAKCVLFFSKPGKDKTTTKLYALCSITYLGAMVASNSALKYVSYPFQVLGKSCKPIPVMLLGVLLARKRYYLLKYFCVLLIVIGVAIFVYKDSKASSSAAESVFGYGELLLIASLTLDGLTGVTQEKMRSEHQTGSHYMMANVNLWSILYLTVTVLVTGEGLHFLEFVSRYPYVIWNILTFGVASALGQHFIFVTVTTFGPLTCSIMTTTRKFFTILGSVILFANPLLPRQWAGVALVFTGLGLDSLYGKSKPQQPK
ncbi:solute carrier family 35 member B1-like [Acanthaster planci]|uniref:Solute carrier family 35 member B1-like n=1 Tax=Acanthaster planci TaxID=133434 RepID=A0A8B7XXA1_ACAPL|nr:solute carrier family 35 member B1-like [Acanthaster planci]